MSSTTELGKMKIHAIGPDDNSITRSWTRQEAKAWFLALFVGTTALYSTRTTMPLAAPVIAKQHQWSKTETGTVLSSFFWGYTLTQVLGGYLSDQFGGEWVLLCAAGGWSLLTFFTPNIIQTSQQLGFSLSVLVAARVLLGAFQGMHFPSMTSLSSRNLNSHERTSFYSAVTAGASLGSVLTGTVGSYMLSYYGWSAVFHFIGFLSICWVTLLYYGPFRHYQKKNVANSTSPIIITYETGAHMKVPWLEYFKKTAFWSCVIGHMCQNNCYFILMSWLPTYFHDTFPDAKSMLFNTVPWLVSFPIIFLGRWLTNQLIQRGFSVTATRKIVETLCLGGEALPLLVIGRVSSFHAALFCMTLSLASSGFHNCAILVNPQDLAPKHSGSVFGLMNMAGAIPGFVGVYIAGYILDVTKSWASVFETTALINLFGCVIYLLFGSGRAIVS